MLLLSPLVVRLIILGTKRLFSSHRLFDMLSVSFLLIVEFLQSLLDMLNVIFHLSKILLKLLFLREKLLHPSGIVIFFRAGL